MFKHGKKKNKYNISLKLFELGKIYILSLFLQGKSLMGFSTSSPRVIKVLSASRSSSRSASRDTVSSVQSTPKVIKFDVIWFTLFVSNFQFIVFNTFRVSTKWLNLLRTFVLFLRMKRNEFCTIFLRNLRKTGNIFCEMLRMKRNFSFAQFFSAKPQVLRKM